MRRRPPRSTRTDTLVPDTTHFRSDAEAVRGGDVALLLDGVAVGDPLGRGAGVQRRLDLGNRGAVEAGAERRKAGQDLRRRIRLHRSEEHTSELQSLMRTSYAVFCLKKKTLRSKD